MKIIDLYNPNKFTVPVMIRSGNGLTEVRVESRKHIQITQDQVTDEVARLTNLSHGMLIKTVLD